MLYLALGTMLCPGVRALGKQQLVFDLLVYPSQLAVTEKLVGLVPEVATPNKLVVSCIQVKFNLNHLGYPDISNSSAYTGWASSM